MTIKPNEFSCPSVQPDAEGAQVFGVVLGTVEEPRVAYLSKGVAVDDESLTDIAEQAGVLPTRIFRYSGKCVSGQCMQFKDGACSLGKNIRAEIDPIDDNIPACSLRSSCRWFAENGSEVCLRCPKVTTTYLKTNSIMDRAVMKGH